jgi:hypothetical protein
MLFIFVVEMGFLMYNWAVINFYTSTTSVTAATQGQFTETDQAGPGAADQRLDGKQSGIQL